MLINHYLVTKCCVDDYQAIISVFDSNGSNILQLEINDRRGKYVDSEYTVSYCMYHNKGLYQMDEGNRFEYFLNGSFIGYNYFVVFEDEDPWNDDMSPGEIEMYEKVDEIRYEINKLILMDRIFPEIYQMIDHQPFDNLSICSKQQRARARAHLF